MRADVAMTGEITLRGEVLPIGGLKEKLLAAHRGGINIVLIPEDNRKDLAEIPKNVKDKLDIRPVKWIDQVLEVALQHSPVPADDKEKSEPTEKVKSKSKSAGKKRYRAHPLSGFTACCSPDQSDLARAAGFLFDESVTPLV